MPDRIPAATAARLLLEAQGLCEDPGRKANKREISKLIDRLGFVQVDTINVVARAHDLTLWSRLEGYEPRMLKALLEKDRALFEHWTHDASVIPVRWYATSCTGSSSRAVTSTPGAAAARHGAGCPRS